MDSISLECVFWFIFIWNGWSSCALELHNVNKRTTPGMNWTVKQLHQTSLAINKPSWKPTLEIYPTLLFHGRSHLHGSCWLTISQPSFPTGEWKESNNLILTCFKDFVDFGLIVIKNILLCTVEDLHLVCCNRQQLCDARWQHEIASKDCIIGVLLPSVWTEISVASTHKPRNY